MTPNPRLMAPEAEAAAEWLLRYASWPVVQAREEWETKGVTPLRCGLSFAALRLPVRLVEVVAPRRDPATVDVFLGEALNQAPAFRCGTGRRYYVLVEEGVTRWWRDLWREIACIGASWELKVPRPDLFGHSGRTGSYWAVPIRGPGQLGSGHAVAQLMAHARYRLAEQGAEHCLTRAAETLNNDPVVSGAVACTYDLAVSARTLLAPCRRPGFPETD